MKPMVYGFLNVRPEILGKGNYKNYNYTIVSFHSHPCAYVQVTEADKVYDDCTRNKYITSEAIGKIDCHGGITYANEHGLVANEYYHKGRWLGWDYNHFGDYSGLITTFNTEESHKWTTEEIYEDVKGVIEQLIKMKEE